MATIIPFLREQSVFDPEMIQSMSTALDDACLRLKLADHDTRNREIIATRIIELARRGERDPVRLCQHVLREAGAV